MPEQPAKVCILCGRDCSTRRRERRAEGYVCHDCLRRDMGVPPIQPGGVQGRPIDVELDEAGEDGAPATCDVCARRLSEGSTSCAMCRYDSRVGLKAGVLVGGRAITEADLRCARCGYDLHGLRQLRCPECAEPMAIRYARNRDQGFFHGLTRREVIVSGAMLGGGLALATTIEGPAWGPEALGAYLLGYLLAYLAGGAAYFLCSWMWLGADFGWPAIALRLAGAFAVSDMAASALGASVGVSLLTWLLPAVLLCVFMWRQLDLELHDAFISSFLVHAARMGVMWGLVPNLM